MPAPYQYVTDRILFLMPNQQCQSTENNDNNMLLVTVKLIQLIPHFISWQTASRGIPSFQCCTLWWKDNVLHNTRLNSCTLCIFVLAETL